MKVSVTLSLLLLIQTGCSSDTFFASTTVLKTPEGDELTTEFCSSDRIEYLTLKKRGKDIRAEQTLLSIKFNNLWAEIYQLSEEGYQLTEEGKNLLLENKQLGEKDDRLVATYNRQAGRLGSLPLKEKINLLGELNNLTEKHLNLEKRRVKVIERLKNAFHRQPTPNKPPGELYALKAEYSRLSAERDSLAEKYNRFESDYFKFSIEVCHLLAQGHQLTERGRKLAAELNQMESEYKQLLLEHDRFVAEHNRLRNQGSHKSNEENLIAIRKQQIANSQSILRYAEKMRSAQKQIVDMGFSKALNPQPTGNGP